MSSDNHRDIEMLYQRVGETERTLERIDATLGLLVDNMEKVISKVDAPHETKWGPIIAALALVLGLAGGYTTMIVQPIHQSIEDNRHLNDKQSQWQLRVEREFGYLEGLRDAQ